MLNGKLTQVIKKSVMSQRWVSRDINKKQLIKQLV